MSARAPSPRAAWKRLELLEHGGFAGLLRGARCTRAETDADQRRQLDRCVAEVLALPLPGAPAAPATHPDQQALRLRIERARGAPWQADFDRAALPAPVDALRRLLPLRPLAP